MRLATILFLMLALIAASVVAFGQEGIKYAGDKIVNEAQSKGGDFNSYQTNRKFILIEIFSGTDSGKYKQLITKPVYVGDGDKYTIWSPGDTAFIFLPKGPDLKGLVEFKNRDQAYDTTFTLKEIIDDASTTSSRWGLSNIAKATNSAKPDVYNKSFTYVQVVSTASSQKITTTCDRVEFYSEKAQGHGYVKILVDGQQVAMIFQGSAPYNTDFKRGIPSWYYNFPKKTPTSPAGEHTIEFITDAGNQYILDFLKTFTYTLKPR